MTTIISDIEELKATDPDAIIVDNDEIIVFTTAKEWLRHSEMIVFPMAIIATGDQYRNALNAVEEQ